MHIRATWSLTFDMCLNMTYTSRYSFKIVVQTFCKGKACSDIRMDRASFDFEILYVREYGVSNHSLFPLDRLVEALVRGFKLGVLTRDQVSKCFDCGRVSTYILQYQK